MNNSKFLLKNILWSFDNDVYDSQREFYKALKKYNESLTKKEFDLEDFVAIKSDRMIVQYSYWDEQEDDTIETEIQLKADNKTSFTAVELVYKIHNEVQAKLKEKDNHFFEGLLLFDGENPNNPDIPYYFLIQGS